MDTERAVTCCQHKADEPSAFNDLIGRYEGITLSQLEDTKARLMTRVESKHLMTLAQCRSLVQSLGGSYRILEIQGKRIGRYETMYYDTPEFLSYYQHHNGKANRYKLRFRHYDASDETFLEVKKKDNKGETQKNRMKTCGSASGFLPAQVEFLRSVLPYDCRAFIPVMKTVYNRITLVSADSAERITFDTDLAFENGTRVITYPDLVIGEIKYEKGTKNSPALHALHEMGIRKRGFSKYCIGVSLLYDWLKHNRFKENLLFLSRISGRGSVPC